ncbi:MAG: hypothetical protein HW384_2282 [Dehalococcoidia bacterium]|nr:hypothetical protein [Dehalococcoidia bacterium]MBF8304423.1 hypothetical protein [Dehalococcoidia bacterium]
MPCPACVTVYAITIPLVVIFISIYIKNIMLYNMGFFPVPQTEVRGIINPMPRASALGTIDYAVCICLTKRYEIRNINVLEQI